MDELATSQKYRKSKTKRFAVLLMFGQSQSDEPQTLFLVCLMMQKSDDVFFAHCLVIIVELDR